MKNRIRPPVKVDEKGRVIRDPRVRARSWRLNVPASITGLKKERKFFETESQAKAYATSLLAARQDAGQDIVAQLRAKGMSVTQALEYALRHAPSQGTPVPLKQACASFISSRRNDNCKERYLANLESQFKQVREDLGDATLIDAISRAQLELFLRGLTGKDGDTPATPKTRSNAIITLNALFNFAVSQGWRGENPAATLRRPKLDEVPITILSPEEVQQLLAEARQPAYADIFPALLIQLFAGPRRSELPHLRWDWIRDRYLRLEKTKIRRKRAVELSEAVLAWLAPFRAREGRILSPDDVAYNARDTRNVEDAYTYRLGQLATEAQVTLPKNVLRHTAITYRDALTGDQVSSAD